jgi:hypothetical protein
VNQLEIIHRLICASFSPKNLNIQVSSRVSTWYPPSLRLDLVREVTASVGRDRREGMGELRHLYRLLVHGMWIEGDQECANLPIHSRRTICEESEFNLNADILFSLWNQRIPLPPFFFREGFSCREALEVDSRIGFWSVWCCHVRLCCWQTYRFSTIGYPSSAADEISGEIVAIKLVTRVFDKIQLAKRALREITLLRHFASHENITGLIDVDAISPDFNEMYVHLIQGNFHLSLLRSYIFMEVRRPVLLSGA